jgi:hypothetical protein
VTINAPLHPETEGLFNNKLISKMKRGAYLVNTARGKICDRDAVVRALESGQLAGYAGDVWFPQPAPKDHPWRTMPHHGMTPHISGTSLSAQARYAAGTREILECWFEGRPIRDEYLIVDGGKLAGTGAHSYSAGDATGGSEEAAKFKSVGLSPLATSPFASYRPIWVCSVSAISLPSSVSTRVCQTWVRRPRWISAQRPTRVEPAGAPAMKFVLLSSVVVPLDSAGRLAKAAAPPSVSAKLMIAPPWAKPPSVQRSGLTVMRAVTASDSALRNSIASACANGSG